MAEHERSRHPCHEKISLVTGIGFRIKSALAVSKPRHASSGSPFLRGDLGSSFRRYSPHRPLKPHTPVNLPSQASDIRELKYIEAVLLEALRLYAPAYLVGRCANRDVQLGSYTLEKGTTVLISPYVMHRSREYWSDADHFNPDRWLEVQQRPGYSGFMGLMSNVGEAVNGAYVPFGAGPRNCIGTGGIIAWTSRGNPWGKSVHMAHYPSPYL